MFCKQAVKVTVHIGLVEVAVIFPHSTNICTSERVSDIVHLIHNKTIELINDLKIDQVEVFIYLGRILATIDTPMLAAA